MTKIEWTEKVWNPSIGCDKVSAGCKFCYKTPHHIYQILTKRDKIMQEYFTDKRAPVRRIVPNNVWLGVSVENATFKKRIDALRKINAKIRFISFEPPIGSVGELDLSGIHWAIVGGESGQQARPMKEEWVEEIFKQCKEQNVAFFFKQWGSWSADGVKKSKKENGRLFKGQVWSEYPMLKN